MIWSYLRLHVTVLHDAKIINSVTDRLCALVATCKPKNVHDVMHTKLPGNAQVHLTTAHCE